MNATASAETIAGPPLPLRMRRTRLLDTRYQHDTKDTHDMRCEM